MNYLAHRRNGNGRGWNNNPDGELFYFYKNIGTDLQPEFDKSAFLRYVNDANVLTRKKACNARFAVTDYNNDGIMDLIFVDYRDGYHNPARICIGTDG